MSVGMGSSTPSFVWPRSPVLPALSACVLVLSVSAGLAVAGEPAVLRPAAARPLPTGRPAAKIDPAVAPAGGERGQRCGHCGKAACPQCRLRDGHCGGSTPHARCQHGLCPAHCPVRPDVFGFYGTQWRRWPGSGVVPASATDAAAPARPARSQVPSAAEESLPLEEAAEEPAAPPAAVPQDDADPPVREDREEAAADAAADLSRTAWRSFTQAARRESPP
jgi:hypothetical protein